MFVYTTQEDQVIFKKFLGFLTDSNKVWAKNAWALVISLARTNYSHNDKPNRFAFHDTGMAVSNLLLQAMALDVFVHQMGGFSIDMVKEHLNLTAGIEPVAMMAVGYLGDGESLPPELLRLDENRKTRKSVQEFVYKNTFSDHAFEE
jgi:nitroreductase